jgi:argininosuccinate lyase
VSRFSEPQDPAFRALNASIGFDRRLWPHDVAQSRAHARMLAAQGIISADDRDALLAGLDAVEAELRDGSFPFAPDDEDIHMALERRLTELAGPVGGRLHTARSRNDQVATDVALFTRAAALSGVEAVTGLLRALVDAAERHVDWPLPGYTHLQRAIGVTVGHHLHAWIEMLERDRTRFEHALDAATPSPLGAGALAGSTLPLPVPANGMRNSLDAVGDRDFALDYLYAATVLFTHLSRIGEELVLWTSSEFGFARLPESAATGSSMMPQKLNPDVAELARGKAGTAIGRLTGLLAVVKGLPLAYDRDLQEDKAPVFGARHDVRGALAALTVLVEGLRFDRERLTAAAADPLLYATDAAEALVREGVPFREAHERIAAQVRDGTFIAPTPGFRPPPGPGGAKEALRDARGRLAAEP